MHPEAALVEFESRYLQIHLVYPTCRPEPIQLAQILWAFVCIAKSELSSSPSTASVRTFLPKRGAYMLCKSRVLGDSVTPGFTDRIRVFSPSFRPPSSSVWAVQSVS